MEDNGVAKILKFIGIGIIIVGILAFLIIGRDTESPVLTISGILGSIISGMVFVGFSEIIHLLQLNYNRQSNIIKLLKETLSKSINSSADALTDQNVISNHNESINDKYATISAVSHEHSVANTDINNQKIPIKLLKDNEGRVICPVCNTSQDGNRYSCLQCGQIFINGQPGVPYWCGKCGKAGPYGNVCPQCSSSLKLYNN